MAAFDRNEHHPTTARLDGVAADDLIRRPVGPLDEDVGLDEADDLGGSVLVEDDDRVDAVERRKHFCSFMLWRNWTARSFVTSHRRIGIQSDDEHVAEMSRVLQVADVAGMEKIEDAVGKDNPSPVCAGSLDDSPGLFPRKHTGRRIGIRLHERRDRT